MFFLLIQNILTIKYDIELSIKYTASCPNSRESMLVINHGNKTIKPVRNGITRVRLYSGYYHLEVSHPWCIFYPVELNIQENGHFTALTNLTQTSTFPISIKHLPNKDDDPIMMMFKSPMMLLMGGIPLLFMFIKKTCLTPENLLKIQEKQKQLIEEQKKLKEKKKNQ